MASGNVIQKIIKLVLDRDAAKKAQADAEGVTQRIDESWKSLATKVAGYLSVAFLVDKMVAFGKAAVAEAASSDATWRQLKGTIDATGESFDGMEKQLRDLGDAFQDATVHDDDAFAESLTRMISLTGDTKASINNMALVANVAAQFFKGELEPATNLVSKAMNGNVAALQKMGIHATSAQNALEILAQRSMGAASRETQTFDGKLKQMNEQWKDVLKSLGQAIIGSDGATDATTVLRAAITKLGEWIDTNKDQITAWVTNGVRFAIDATDVLIRAVLGATNAIGGGFLTSLGLASQGIAKLAKGYAIAQEAGDRFFAMLGNDTAKKSLENGFAAKLTKQADAIDAWGESIKNLGVDRVQKGIDILSTPLFSSDQFANAPKRTPAKLVGEGNKPQVASGSTTDAQKEVEKAIEEFHKAELAAKNMANILGDRFDSIGADVERTTKLLNVLASNGIEPASMGFTGLGEHLRELTDFTVPYNTATKDLAKNLGTDLAIGAITATSSLEQLKQQQTDTLKAIQSLIDAGISPTNTAVTDLVTKYNELKDAVADVSQLQAQTAAWHDLGDALRSDLFNAALDGVDAIERLKAEKASLLKAIQSLIANGISKEDAAFKQLTTRYKNVTDAINEQTVAMQMQAAAADFLADALGTALQGGLHEAAAQKAKQNAIEAAEMLVRAGVFAIFGDAPHATASLVLAAQFGAVAAAWGALAASSHGGGGGGSAPSISAGAASASGGSDVSSSRQVSNRTTTDKSPATADVSIYLVGPGFDALNPEVQRVVYGAAQQAAERYGPNARVRSVSRGGFT